MLVEWAICDKVMGPCCPASRPRMAAARRTAGTLLGCGLTAPGGRLGLEVVTAGLRLAAARASRWFSDCVMHQHLGFR